MRGKKEKVIPFKAIGTKRYEDWKELEYENRTTLAAYLEQQRINKEVEENISIYDSSLWKDQLYN